MRDRNIAKLFACAPGDGAATIQDQDLIGARQNLPTLLVHGDADPRLPWSVRALSALLPHVRLAPIPNAGPFPWFEQPDAFRRILRGLLLEASSSAVGDTPPPIEAG